MPTNYTAVGLSRCLDCHESQVISIKEVQHRVADDLPVASDIKPQGIPPHDTNEPTLLPSTSRLQQIIKGVPCEFDFNNIALTSIGAQFAEKEGHLCYSTLILDEINVRKAVSFNTRKYKLDGFIDYGDEMYQEDTAADHALVLMFVALFHAWVQPKANFATRNAAPGGVLARLVLHAILELKKQNALVVAIISDSASTNKAMWSKFGATGKIESPRYKVEHPCDPGLHLHFMWDTPHLIKCIRNHLLRHQYGMVRVVELCLF